MNLRVALDARPLTTSQGGVATYCRGLVYGLGQEARDTTVLLYAKHAPPAELSWGPAVSWRTMPGRLWLPALVPRALQAGRVQVFHGTNHMAPPWSPAPTVITVHDLSLLRMPEYHTWRNRLLTVPQMLLSLRRATRIIAVSQATATDVAALPGIDNERLRVIPEAPTPGLAPAAQSQIDELARRLQLPPDFFLFLGALEPRKNVLNLVRAMAALRDEDDHRSRLVIAGAEGWKNQSVRDEVDRLGAGDLIQFAGYIAPRDLPALYGAARAFVYPSFFEGFGLPPLEAMACGTPVICSNTSSLPEVTGDAALLIDPHAAASLIAAMRRLRDDDMLRAELRARGLERAALFSWQRTARETLAVYREAATEHGWRDATRGTP